MTDFFEDHEPMNFYTTIPFHKKYNEYSNISIDKQAVYVYSILVELNLIGRVYELQCWKKYECRFLFFLLYETETLSIQKMIYLFCFCYDYEIFDFHKHKENFFLVVQRMQHLFRKVDLVGKPKLKNIWFFLQHSFF